MRKRMWMSGFGAVVLALVTMASLSAIPVADQFELDGDAVSQGVDDWSNVVGPTGTGGASIVRTFIADGSGNATIFTGGGSKDINDITAWKWKDQLGGLPDKDNITNAYAAAYQNAAGDLIVYFGADRFATAGDAQLGFWFFHQQVQAIGEKFVGADGVTPVSHTNGDVLVLANFSNGGSFVTIQVYQWLNGVLVLQNGGSAATNATCGQNVDPRVCAITNTGSQPAPWDYTPKPGDGPPGSFPAVSFFEGGINLSAFIDTSIGGCFSSFLAETRSSTSTTATLKDFALGSFDTCELNISKSCPAVAYDPATNLLTYTSEIVVENKGFGTVYDLTVVDTPSAPATAETFTLASLAKNTSHTFTHQFTYQAGLTTPNPPVNTATATAAIAPGGLQIVDAGSATATCPSVSFDASLSISKTCTAGLEVQNGRVVVVVSIAGTVCNVPPAQVPGQPPVIPEPISSVVVSDVPAFFGGTISLNTLAVGECKDYTAKYYPDALIGGSSNAANQTYLDTAAVTGTGQVTQATKQNSASANCPLCPPIH